ncbi:MAG: UDP-N-acetylmuramoyl-tripeptide--D-alanyl-D-alanine ligase [Acidothermaceae bacterium]
MISLSLAEVAKLCGGQLASPSDKDVVIDRCVVADSRAVATGALFVAVRGARVDGHDFATQAVAAGAAAVLASRPVDVASVLVDDTVLGLGLLARGYLARLDAAVVGITGSSGKTSTKDLLAQVLGAAGPTVSPVGSFNTEVGVPLTVLRADADTRFLVLEMSARGVGHIAYLCGVATPRIGVVLNVGAAHIGEFGSREVVAQAKGELVEALAPDGVAVLNADDPLVAAMRSRTQAQVITFGLTPSADVHASDVVLDELARPRFRLHTPSGSADVRLGLHGAHHVSNALAAVSAALELGVSVEATAQALGRAEPLSHWRMEVSTRPDGVTIVNDAYNANPESMRAALAALASMGRSGPRARRTWAVLGEMAELGLHSEAEHFDTGATVAAGGVDRLVVVGQAASAIADGAVRGGFSSSDIECLAGADEAVTFLAPRLEPGDVVLVKASRSADLQQVAQRLLATGTDAGVGADA